MISRDIETLRLVFRTNQARGDTARAIFWLIPQMCPKSREDPRNSTIKIDFDKPGRPECCLARSSVHSCAKFWTQSLAKSLARDNVLRGLNCPKRHSFLGNSTMLLRYRFLYRSDNKQHFACFKPIYVTTFIEPRTIQNPDFRMADYQSVPKGPWTKISGLLFYV